MGAAVVNMAAGDIFANLQSGTLDAAEFVGPYTDLGLGLYQITKNYYFPSFVEPGLATELAVDKAKFLALPEDLQEIVRSCCQAAYDDMASDFYANDPRALAALVNEHGVQIKTFPDDIVEAGAKASVELLNEIRDGGDPGAKKAADSFVAALELLRTRTANTDLKFLQYREKYLKLS
jgi:TRAP-type mannitol/chloroaromatic compound transport system substrate-binding protein